MRRSVKKGCPGLLYLEWDGQVSETRKERQKRERASRQGKRMTIVRTVSLMTGLSMSSLLFAGLTDSTEAMMTASVGEATQFGAADHFPGWYDGLNSELQATVTKEAALLEQMEILGGGVIQTPAMQALEQDAKQINELGDAADKAFQLIKQAAQADEGNYQLALGNPADAPAVVASFARTAAIAQAKLAAAEQWHSVSRSYLLTAQSVLARALLQTQTVLPGVTVFQLVDDATVSQSVYGTSVLSSVYGGSVLQSVYGGTLAPSFNGQLSLLNSFSTTSPAPPPGQTVVQGVYGAVYGGANSACSGTLSPNTAP